MGQDTGTKNHKVENLIGSSPFQSFSFRGSSIFNYQSDDDLLGVDTNANKENQFDENHFCYKDGVIEKVIVNSFSALNKMN